MFPPPLVSPEAFFFDLHLNPLRHLLVLDPVILFPFVVRAFRPLPPRPFFPLRTKRVAGIPPIFLPSPFLNFFVMMHDRSFYSVGNQWGQPSPQPSFRLFFRFFLMHYQNCLGRVSWFFLILPLL